MPAFDTKMYFPSGRPAWRREIVVRILRHLLRFGAVGMHDPDVLAAFAIGDKGDPLAVGRKTRLAVERHAAVDQLGFAALDRQRVDVAEQLEHDGLAVGRDVQRQPGALIGGEFDFAVGLERQALLFFLVVLFLSSFFSSFLSLSGARRHRPASQGAAPGCTSRQTRRRPSPRR